jgi:hypothetical protein
MFVPAQPKYYVFLEFTHRQAAPQATPSVLRSHCHIARQVLRASRIQAKAAAPGIASSRV